MHAGEWEQSQVHNIDRNACIGCETTAGCMFASVEGATLSVRGVVSAFVNQNKEPTGVIRSARASLTASGGCDFKARRPPRTICN